jgi:anti-sigma factor RsiW
MDPCNACRDQLLDYLYDLLDGEETQALRAHLESCPACQEALKQAQRQQSLLAAAAKMEFAEVRFEPPVEEPVPATHEVGAPTLLPLIPRRRRPRHHSPARNPGGRADRSPGDNRQPGEEGEGDLR